MARIPLVTEFEAKGLDRAIKEFKKLEGAGAKAGYALKQAFLPATAALAGLTAAAGLSVKAAIEDTAQQAELARTLKATTEATEAQVAAVETYIAETEKAAAVSDSELRPAFANLVRATGDVTKAQDLMTLALDVAAATGKDLETVTESLQEGFQGEVGPLKELDKSLTDMIASGASADEVMAQLADTFGGAAQESTETLEGRFKLMKIELDNAKEAIGMALLPVLEDLLPILESMANFIGNNTDLILGIGAAVGSFSAFIVGANVALKAWNTISTVTKAVNKAMGWSFKSLWVATGVGIIVAIIAAIVVLQMKFNILGKAVDALKFVFSKVWDAIRGYINLWIDALNVIISAINKIPGIDIPEIPRLASQAKEAAKHVDALANKSLRALEQESKAADKAIEPLMYSIEGVRRAGDDWESTLGRVNVETDKLNEGVETATTRLDRFFDSLDKEEATNQFVEDLTDIQTKLSGVTEGSEAWQEAQNEAYEALRTLREGREDLDDAFFEVLKLEIDTGDLQRAAWLMQNIVDLGGREIPTDLTQFGVSDVNIAALMGAVPQFANGGIITAPTLGIVGEAGPEAVIPLDQLGRFGGNVVVNNYYPPGVSEQDVAAAMDGFVRSRGSIPATVTGNTTRR
jgi:hypothetical protein